MEPLARALHDLGDDPKWPPALEQALGHELDYPGYVIELVDGRTVYASAVNKKHRPNVTVYRGYVEESDGTRTDLEHTGEDLSPVSIARAWKVDPA